MLKRGGVTAPRIVVANGTFAITRRTAFRKLFWTPSDPLVARGFLYALADAQQKACAPDGQRAAGPAVVTPPSATRTRKARRVTIGALASSAATRSISSALSQ